MNRAAAKGGLLLAAVAAWLLTGESTQAVTVSDSAPATRLPLLGGDGAQMALDELKGSLVYVDFWASWCAPCRESLQHYEKLNQELGSEDFRIVAINLDEEPADAHRFLDRYPVTYTVLSDPDGKSAKDWSVKAMPSSYLVDTQGTVVRAWAGYRSEHLEELRHELSQRLP